MLKILDGKAVRDARKTRLIQRIKLLKRVPTLAIIQVGDRSDTTAYVNAKKRFAADIGVEVRHIHLEENVDQDVILKNIKNLNVDETVGGIIIQLPLPEAIDRDAVINTIDPKKDTDALTKPSIDRWSKGDALTRSDLCTKVRPMYQGPTLYPATARGVGELLGFYHISLKDKKVCVIGRSALVGTPVAALCRTRGAMVTVCHSQTADLKKETLASDIIISAVGKPGLVTAAHVKPGQVVIDVGINRVEGKLIGDVDFEAVKAVLGDAGAISPVPGGVGPMTVLALFENLIDCATM
ncbi:MAG: bifunctional 5,10-methylenetetrahydrofolate dehydrogenase/5,10-methenyltetrahydrofolate cyclohydrolase [Patescibacteria group bacterium]|nr:bifunctional 5,10-methylenetetrahydrofolate dehydrogenase/5,10-methenyltetrahydrofolate cyclohydrolase [Patescibacteria group bacterium]